jgi:2-keto-4-pentenoate hydratase/2-oxohepta-3-ene-1,7-dioic acid hydratase in catechol pathway
MKLASYVAGGKECYGVVSGDGIITMRGHASLRDALAAGALEGMRTAAAMAKPDVKLADVRFLPVIPNPHKILCAGVNYRDHAAEVGRELPKQPSMFIRFTDTLVGHQSEMIRPRLSDNFDFEGELTMVIGKGGRHIPIDKALDHVAGYTIANELSARDLGRRDQLPDSTPFKWDWVGQKCFDDACPIGPWIIPASDIKDPQKLGIKLWVNDVIKQDSNTSDMIFNLAEQLSHLSSRITLYPGDIILTGTPAGVGAARREFLKAGDTTRVWVENVGTLTNKMA